MFVSGVVIDAAKCPRKHDFSIFNRRISDSSPPEGSLIEFRPGSTPVQKLLPENRLPHLWPAGQAYPLDMRYSAE